MKKKVHVKNGVTGEYLGFMYEDGKGNITEEQFDYQAKKLNNNDYMLAERLLTIYSTKFSQPVGTIEEDLYFNEQTGKWDNVFWDGLEK